MFGGLWMKGDVSGARLGKIGDDAIHRLHHQMHIDIRCNAVFA